MFVVFVCWYCFLFVCCFWFVCFLFSFSVWLQIFVFGCLVCFCFIGSPSLKYGIENCIRLVFACFGCFSSVFHFCALFVVFKNQRGLTTVPSVEQMPPNTQNMIVTKAAATSSEMLAHPKKRQRLTGSYCPCIIELKATPVSGSFGTTGVPTFGNAVAPLGSAYEVQSRLGVVRPYLVRTWGSKFGLYFGPYESLYIRPMSFGLARYVEQSSF